MFGGRIIQFSLRDIRLSLVMFAFMAVFLGCMPLSAEASAFAQGFETEETNIATGAVMSFKPGATGEVELANTTRVSQMVGVIGEKPLITLSGGEREVQVVTAGIAPVLVSTINGDIKSGDKITASPIDGVGMKATESSQIIGTAQADFDTSKATTRQIADKTGKNETVSVGLVDAQINVMYFAVEDPHTYLPAFMRDIASSVAGREVSAIRVLVSTVALLLGFVSIAVLLYSSVRSSIISIGRNPLSESAVHKSLLEVGLITIGILLLTLLAIYLILTT